jgi:hypothetical protein
MWCPTPVVRLDRSSSGWRASVRWPCDSWSGSPTAGKVRAAVTDQPNAAMLRQQILKGGRGVGALVVPGDVVR